MKVRYVDVAFDDIVISSTNAYIIHFCNMSTGRFVAIFKCI